MSMTEAETKSLAEQKRTNDAHLANMEIGLTEARAQTRLLSEIRFLLAKERTSYRTGLAAEQQVAVTREALEEAAMEAFRSANKDRPGLASIFAGTGGPVPEDPHDSAEKLGLLCMRATMGENQRASSGCYVSDWIRGAKAVEASVNARMATRIESAREGLDKAQAEAARLTRERDRLTVELKRSNEHAGAMIVLA
jgi:hypothetical protein